MALITCKKCGKNISDQANTCIHCGESIEKVDITCPECNNKLPLNVDKCTNCGYIFKKNKKKKKNDKIKLPKASKKQVAIKMVLLTMQLVFGILSLVNLSNFVYGEKTLLLYLLPSILLFISSVLVIVNLIKKNGRTFLNIIQIISVVCALFVIVILGYNGKKFYYDYENNWNIMVLSDIYSKDTAKEVLTQMSEIFDYELVTGESANWRLSSFYHFEDEDYILYIEDYNTNTYHNFSVNLDNEGMIKNLYWDFNEDIKLYLYRNGKKTNNFYYYYVMNSYDTLINEFEYDIGTSLNEKLNMSPNAEIEYESTIYYNSGTNLFTKKGIVKDGKETNFNIIFSPVDITKVDNSIYNVVDWSVEIK